MQLRAVEHAEVRDVDYDYGEGRHRIEYVEGTHTTYTEKFVIGEKVSSGGPDDDVGRQDYGTGVSQP